MYWLYILPLAVVLYVLGSIRVLRQYERGVVFLLGRFEGVRGSHFSASRPSGKNRPRLNPMSKRDEYLDNAAQ